MEADAGGQQGDLLEAGVMGREQSKGINIEGEGLEFGVAGDGLPALAGEKHKITAGEGV